MCVAPVQAHANLYYTYVYFLLGCGTPSLTYASKQRNGLISSVKCPVKYWTFDPWSSDRHSELGAPITQWRGAIFHKKETSNWNKPNSLVVRPRGRTSKAIGDRCLKWWYLNWDDLNRKLRTRKQRTDIGKYSLVSRTVESWNQLPAGLIASFFYKLNTYRKRVKNVVESKGIQVGIKCKWVKWCEV